MGRLNAALEHGEHALGVARFVPDRVLVEPGRPGQENQFVASIYRVYPVKMSVKEQCDFNLYVLTYLG